MHTVFVDQAFSCDSEASVFATCEGNSSGRISYDDIVDEHLPFDRAFASLMLFVWIATGLTFAYQ